MCTFTLFLTYFEHLVEHLCANAPVMSICSSGETEHFNFAHKYQKAHIIDVHKLICALEALGLTPETKIKLSILTKTQISLVYMIFSIH